MIVTALLALSLLLLNPPPLDPIPWTPAPPWPLDVPPSGDTHYQKQP